MLVERPPFFYRFWFRKAWWLLPQEQKCVYLTFDDGPIPEATPEILDLLDRYSAKACFFCVGDNVRKYPHLFDEILSRGHQVGNHTYNHLQGWKCRTRNYLRNVTQADALMHSPFFRPPHGHIRSRQGKRLELKYQMVMWDVVTRDYERRLTAQEVFRIVRCNARNGSIIVFHDSLKSIDKLRIALPLCLEWLLAEGFTFELLPCPSPRK